MTTTVADIAERVGSLRPLPDTAVKLLSVINNPQASISQIVDVVKYDQAVTGDVLRLCNSAYFGLARRVESLDQAMKCLGTAKVLQLVISIHTSEMFDDEQKGYGLDRGVLWRHSVAVALAAEMVGKSMKMGNASLLYTAGLLHDIGKLVLNEYVAEEFSEIIRCVTEDRMSFAEAEQRTLGFSHQDVGGMVAEKWNLPDPIVQCIRHHHDPGRLVPSDPLVDAVHLANCVCLLMGIGLGEDGLYCRANVDVMRRHELRERDIEMMGADVLVELQQVEQIFAEQNRRVDS